MKQKQRRWLEDLQLTPAADLTNRDGRLQPDYFEGSGALWVPPATELRVGGVAHGRLQGLSIAKQLIAPGEAAQVGTSEQIYVTYPVPSEWEQPIEQSPNWSARNKQLGIGLREAGWQLRRSAKGRYLIEDLIDLVDASDEHVRRFAAKWGPLWMCFRHGKDCLYGSPPSPSQNTEFCQWIPAEPTTAFRIRAKQMKALFDLTACLLDGKPTKEEQWNELGWHIETHAEAPGALGLGSPSAISSLALKAQRSLLSTTVNEALSMAGGPHFWVSWDEAPRARLAIQYGLGFLRIAWLQTAQLLTRATGYSTCTDCGRFFVWHDLKRPEGKNNFCEDCGDKGRKKIWARKHRAANRSKG